MSCKSLFKLKRIHQFCQYICINLNLSIKPTWINRLYYQLFSFISGQVRVSWRFSESKTHDIVDSISVILQDMFHNLVIRSETDWAKYFSLFLYLKYFIFHRQNSFNFKHTVFERFSWSYVRIFLYFPCWIEAPQMAANYWKSFSNIDCKCKSA